MAKGLTEEIEPVTQRYRARMYFDYGRSRLFEDDDTCYDFSWFSHKRAAENWCRLEGVEFIDNRLTRLPGCVHSLVLAARRAGSGTVSHYFRYGFKRGDRKPRPIMEEFPGEYEDGRIEPGCLHTL